MAAFEDSLRRFLDHFERISNCADDDVFLKEFVVSPLDRSAQVVDRVCVEICCKDGWYETEVCVRSLCPDTNCPVCEFMKPLDAKPQTFTVGTVHVQLLGGSCLGQSFVRLW